MSLSPVTANIGEKAQIGVIAVLGLVLAFIAYEIYKLLNGDSNGALGSVAGAVGSIGTVASDAAQAADSVVNATGGALTTLTGTDTVKPGESVKNSSLFWGGIGNFLTTGSLYGDQGVN